MHDCLEWAILPSEAACLARAQALALHLQIPMLSPQDEPPAYLLLVTSDHLAVQQHNGKPLNVDFLANAFLHRLHTLRAREPLLRAVGIKARTPLTVCDATAGFGQDAFMLAFFGADVTLIEREPIMGLLLEDGLARARLSTELMPAASRMHCYVMDAKDYLSPLAPAQYPDVIYLDPMFVHKKSALPNKNMQFLHKLSGSSEDDKALLDLALTRARKRVVIKRALIAPPLAGIKPDFSISSKLLRFDVFSQA